MLSPTLRQLPSSVCTVSQRSFFDLFIYSFIFGCTGSLLLHRHFSSCGEQGLLSSCGARAPHWRGFSCCRAWTPDHGLHWLWCRGLVALEHVEFSRTRAWTHVPCISRWILNHWTTREVPPESLESIYLPPSSLHMSIRTIKVLVTCCSSNPITFSI